jgi:hypothetical protein
LQLTACSLGGSLLPAAAGNRGLRVQELGSAHGFLHERGDLLLFGGGQLRDPNMRQLDPGILDKAVMMRRMITIDPAAKVGRFSRRFSFHDEPQVLERLEKLAADSAVSSAAIVRFAVRLMLEEYEAQEPRTR